MKDKDINLLIAKKQNAEAYKEGIKDLEKEIKEIQQKIELTMFSEEKVALREEKMQKEEEVENLKSTYDNKRGAVEEEILTLKDELRQNIEEIEGKLISKEESDKLKESKKAKEIELAECEKDIKEVKEELKALIDKDGGYEQDTVSLSKKLDDLTAYRKYIRDEEIPEIDNKLKDAIIIEENMNEIKYIKYMKMRMANLSYDSIEKWKEDEEKFQKEVFNKGKPEKTEPEKTEPEKTEPEKTEPEKTEPEKTEPEKTKQTKPEQIQTPQQPKGEYKDISSTSKFKLTRMRVSPITNTIDWEIIDDKGVAGYETRQLDYTKEFFKSDDIQSIIKQCQKRLGEEYDLDSISKELDPNILTILNSLESKDMLNKYVKSVYDLEGLPFELEYDLKDIYKSDMLYNREKSNINKVAKRVEFLDGAEVIKDSLFKRAFGKIKSMIDKHTRKKLVQDNKTYGEVYEEYEGEASYLKEEPKIRNSILNRAKNKVIALENNANHFTSQKLSKENIKSGVKNLGKDFKIFGFKTYGKLIGENPSKTAFKVAQIKNVGHVTKPEEQGENKTSEEIEPTVVSEPVSMEDIEKANAENAANAEIESKKISDFSERIKKFLEENGTPENKEKITGFKESLQSPVDEQAAVEKVNASQKQNKEVIIENPDGTEQIGHRLWSKDDENTK